MAILSCCMAGNILVNEFSVTLDMNYSLVTNYHTFPTYIVLNALV